MAQSQVNVCNLALQRVGAARILSLSDDTPEAREVSLAFESTRRDELRKHRWNFAISRSILAPEVTDPVYEFEYQFVIPADCLRVLRPRDSMCDWQIEGGKILTNEGDTLYLRYIKDVTDVAQWDSSFYSTFAAALAIKLAERLNNSNVKKDVLMREYKDAVAEARRSDGFESGPEQFPEDEWWTVRL